MSAPMWDCLSMLCVVYKSSLFAYDPPYIVHIAPSCILADHCHCLVGCIVVFPCVLAVAVLPSCYTFLPLFKIIRMFYESFNINALSVATYFLTSFGFPICGNLLPLNIDFFFFFFFFLHLMVRYYPWVTIPLFWMVLEMFKNVL